MLANFCETGRHFIVKMLANLYETGWHFIVKITLQFDSRLGLKFENAFDEPRIIVTFVTPKLQAKWNIRYDKFFQKNI